jgi:hypothetical protein
MELVAEGTQLFLVELEGPLREAIERARPLGIGDIDAPSAQNLLEMVTT